MAINMAIAQLYEVTLYESNDDGSGEDFFKKDEQKVVTDNLR